MVSFLKKKKEKCLYLQSATHWPQTQDDPSTHNSVHGGQESSTERKWKNPVLNDFKFRFTWYLRSKYVFQNSITNYLKLINTNIQWKFLQVITHDFVIRIMWRNSQNLTSLSGPPKKTGRCSKGGFYSEVLL
jgi:hypothetical protein